jgi:hypothetical protein
LGGGYEAAARLLSSLASAGPISQAGPEAVPSRLISTMAATVRANQELPRQAAWRRLRLAGTTGAGKLVIVVGVLVGGTAAAAATGSLPPAVQHAVTNVLSAVGIDGPAPALGHAAGSAPPAVAPRPTAPVTTLACPSTANPSGSTTVSSQPVARSAHCGRAPNPTGETAPPQATHRAASQSGHARSKKTGTTTPASAAHSGRTSRGKGGGQHKGTGRHKGTGQHKGKGHGTGKGKGHGNSGGKHTTKGSGRTGKAKGNANPVAGETAKANG